MNKRILVLILSLAILLSACGKEEKTEPVIQQKVEITEDSFRDSFTDIATSRSSIVQLNGNTVSYSYPKDYNVSTTDSNIKINTGIAEIDIRFKSSLVIKYEEEAFLEKCRELEDSLFEDKEIKICVEESSFKSPSDILRNGTVYYPIISFTESNYYLPKILVRFDINQVSMFMEASLNSYKTEVDLSKIDKECTNAKEDYNLLYAELESVISNTFYGDIINGSESEVLEGVFPFYEMEIPTIDFLQLLQEDETIDKSVIELDDYKLNIFGEKKYFECFKLTDSSLAWLPTDGTNNDFNFEISIVKRGSSASLVEEDLAIWAKTFVSDKLFDDKFFKVNRKTLDTYSYSEELRNAVIYYTSFLTGEEEIILPIVYVKINLGDTEVIFKSLLIQSEKECLIDEYVSTDLLEDVEVSTIEYYREQEEFKKTAKSYKQSYYKMEETIKGLLRLIYLGDLESEDYNEE